MRASAPASGKEYHPALLCFDFRGQFCSCLKLVSSNVEIQQKLQRLCWKLSFSRNVPRETFKQNNKECLHFRKSRITNINAVY